VLARSTFSEVFFSLIFIIRTQQHLDVMSEVVKSKKQSGMCELLGMFQYHCEVQEDSVGAHAKCTPIQRIYRKCGNRPLVEVTHVVVFDEKTQKYSLPAHLQDSMPPAIDWKDLSG
jgi:hypothetical protein